MKRRRQFTVLVATDGSPEARAAVALTAAFPWPEGTRVHGVVARRGIRTFQRPQYVVAAFDRAFQRTARDAQHVLRRRWPDATVVVEDKWAADAILNRAQRLGADVIVLGSRSRGVAARLLLGSVSRHVVRRASCAVLIVHGRDRAVTRIVIGVDGSANAHRAGALVAGLPAPPGNQAIALCVVEPMRAPSTPLVPTAARSAISRAAAAAHANIVREAQHDVDNVARIVERSGWKAQAVVRIGHPLPTLLREVQRTRAQLLVIGARGVGGVERLLLGSVAEGVLNRCPVPVLLAR
jgi:nucleotide-binding universal stress UspA family protein